jgi:protein involved in polysaccharide export with SLBB domain
MALGALLIAMSLLAGCTSYDPNDIRAWVKPYEVEVTAEDYIFQPPDELEIHCSQVPELHLQRQRIRPDGKISFEKLGEIEVAGKTPREVSAIVEEKITALYVIPGEHPVDVRVAIYAGSVYYVLGQVARPGPRNYTGRDDVMTSVAMAMPATTAWESKVRVIRPSALEDERPMIFEVNYWKMMTTGDMTKNVLIEKGDIIYVPPTIPASIAMVLEEFLAPVARAFYGAYLVQNPPGSSGSSYSPYGSSQY